MGCKFEVKENDSYKVLMLSGDIDESFELAGVDISGDTIKIDFKDVISVNSIGVRNLQKLVSDLKGKTKIWYSRCSPVITYLLSFNEMTFSLGKLESFYVSFFCSNCNTDEMFLVSHDNVSEVVDKEKKCSQCQDVIEMDDTETVELLRAKLSKFSL